MTCSAQEGGSAGPVSPSCSPCTGVRVGAQQGEVAAEGGAGAGRVDAPGGGRRAGPAAGAARAGASTVAENIAIGRPDATRAEVEAAARAI
ncbi:hypothetical protein, partial [Streptomyces sp. DEF1AK]|uniref:hypothetical protein n=1 Tax=Streptomyces sp. DEF1AK TaxID=2759677 RepID=UPI0019169B3F